MGWDPVDAAKRAGSAGAGHVYNAYRSGINTARDYGYWVKATASGTGFSGWMRQGVTGMGDILYGGWDRGTWEHAVTGERVSGRRAYPNKTAQQQAAYEVAYSKTPGANRPMANFEVVHTHHYSAPKNSQGWFRSMTDLKSGIAFSSHSIGAMGMPVSSIGVKGNWLGLLFGAGTHWMALDQSGDNVLGAENGYARALSRGAGEFIGGDIGLAAGAKAGFAAMTAAAPVLGPFALLLPVIGAVAGGIAGSMVGGAVGDTPFGLAEWGYTLDKPFSSPFLDSQRAATMRQRSMQMIHRSHMNARSALSNEAAAYHL